VTVRFLLAAGLMSGFLGAALCAGGALAQDAPPPASSGSAATDTTAPVQDVERIKNPIAVFAGLDKITARIVSFEVKMNETVQFGALQVTPRVCYTRPDSERPETVGFVEVDEITLKKQTKRIFTGWMFAASPGLNAVEHPIYDVWLTDCKGGKDKAQPPASAAQ